MRDAIEFVLLEALRTKVGRRASVLMARLPPESP